MNKKLRGGWGQKLYYVRDTREIVGDCVLWWAEGGNGYTCELKGAGLFTANEVAKMPRDTDVAYERSAVESLAIRHVRIEALLDLTPEHP